jgi:hypothetical protein
MFTNNEKKRGPPLNTLNDTTIHFNINDDNDNFGSPKKRSRKEMEEYSQTETDYSNKQFNRAKQGNKFSEANLNMGVSLARKGLLPNTPENQHIFQEMNRRDGLINNRAQQDYLEQEHKRQEELEKLQKQHSENMANKRKQEEMLRGQQQQQQHQAEQERMRRQQEEQEEMLRQQQQQEQEELKAQQEKMRKEYEEQERVWQEQRDQMRQQQEKEHQAEQERLRQQQKQQQEQERQQKQQKQQEQKQKTTQVPKTELPNGIIDMENCPAYNIVLPEKKEECNKIIYRKLSLKLHPDKNPGCDNYSKKKFQKLGNICDGNQFIGGGRKKKTKKYFKKKTNFKISKKYKSIKKSKRIRVNKSKKTRRRK